MEDGVSVCITAYNTQNYIKECLDSVISQTWFKSHDNWEIIVGIDGCEKTLKYLETIMGNYKNLRILMMDSNKGTYITSNTIMSQAKYENLFRFDSDDIMCQNLIQTVMNKKGDCCFVRYRFKNFGEGNKGKRGGCGIAHGTMYIKKSVFVKYGGFRPWPCGADTELHIRLSKVEKTKDLLEILMRRRVHSDSLTMSNETGMKSNLRKKYLDFVEELKTKNISEEEATIECVTNTYKLLNVEYRKSDETFNEYVKRVEKNKYDKILQLRKDIQNGNVVKVPCGNGRFVWKKIK